MAARDQGDARQVSLKVGEEKQRRPTGAVFSSAADHRTRSVLRIVVLAVVVEVDYIANNVSVRVDKRDVLSDDHILVVLRSG
jgi:hypothetical protein